MKKLTLQEIKDTLVGCTILGTGGGGSLESGLEAVEKAWNAGHEFKLLCQSLLLRFYRPQGRYQPETRR